MAIYNTSWIHTNASEELNSVGPSGNRTRDLRNYPSVEDISQRTGYRSVVYLLHFILLIWKGTINW